MRFGERACGGVSGFVFDALLGEFEEFVFDFEADEATAQTSGDDARRAASAKRIEYQVARLRSGADDAVEQNFGFLGGMFAQAFFPARRGREFPDRLHLFVSVVAFHGGVIEIVFAFGMLARPDQRFVRVGKIAARQMRRRIGFVPRDVVEDFETQSLQREADAEDVVIGARNPDRAIGLQEPVTLA